MNKSSSWNLWTKQKGGRRRVRTSLRLSSRGIQGHRLVVFRIVNSCFGQRFNVCVRSWRMNGTTVWSHLVSFPCSTMSDWDKRRVTLCPSVLLGLEVTILYREDVQPNLIDSQQKQQRTVSRGLSLRISCNSGKFLGGSLFPVYVYNHMSISDYSLFFVHLKVRLNVISVNIAIFLFGFSWRDGGWFFCIQ